MEKSSEKIKVFNSKSFESSFKGFNDSPYVLYNGDTRELLDSVTKINKPFIDLLVTSPPYNIGKEYEGDLSHEEYVQLHTDVI